MLVSGLSLLVLSAILYITWNIPDAIDELSGKKRKRQIEKLQKASMAIGATGVVASTTQMFKDSEEDEEIANLIQNAHNSYTSEIQSDDDSLSDEVTSFIPEETVEDSVILSSESGNVGKFKNIVILEEITNLEV
jgi:hypothetical protein